jgi:hypothetical protein
MSREAIEFGGFKSAIAPRRAAAVNYAARAGTHRPMTSLNSTGGVPN